MVPASDFTVWFLSCGVGEWAYLICRNDREGTMKPIICFVAIGASQGPTNSGRTFMWVS